MDNRTENNTLIAQFMGYEIMNRTTNGWEPSIFNFHNSWDSLMPVIAKIYKLDHYYKYTEELSSFVNDEKININPFNIGKTYSDIILFIKWYNENK